MTTGEAPPEGIPPDEAFAILGNDTRLEILRTLGEAEGPVGFSALREGVGLRQGGRFNYHLHRLVGHFVTKSDAGYEITRAGRRVLEAVLSGAVTEDPVIDRTDIDYTCKLCGAGLEVNYRFERLEIYCPDCEGLYADKTRPSVVREDEGHMGGLQLPPAGVRDRTADEAIETASLWTHLDFVAIANGVCPRCAARFEGDVTVCTDHEADDGLCRACDRRQAVQFGGRCTNCVYRMDGTMLNYVVGDPEVRSFVAAQGLDPIREGWRWGWDWEEDVRSVDPFEAVFTLAVGDDTIDIHVDDDLIVTVLEA